MPSVLGFHSTHFSPLFGGTVQLTDMLAAAEAAGFGHMGLDLASIDAHLAAGNTLGGLVQELDGRGLSCTDLVALVVGSDDAAALATARRIGVIAQELRSRLCVVAVVEPVPWPELVDRTTRCAQILTDHGVRMAVEFTPYTALSTLQSAVELCEAVGWDRAGLVLDSLHFFRGATPWQDLDALEARQIALVQVSDASGPRPDDVVAESRHGRMIPGLGDLPLQAFAAAVRRSGFDGPVTAEVLSADLRRRDPGTVAGLLHAGLRAHWHDVDVLGRHT